MTLKKLLSIAIMCVMAFTVFACTPPDGYELPNIEEEEQIDVSRTQLFVSNFNGGFGDQWLKNLKAAFEEEYKDVEFTAGKKGVQIMISNGKTVGSTLLSTMESSRDEVFFSEYVYYNDFVSQGKMLNITDVVTDELNGLGDSGTIENKLTAEQKGFFNVGSEAEPQYYALPHYQAFQGVAYDVDMFDEERLYFALDKNNGNNGFVVSKNDTKSYGPDGKTGVDALTGQNYSDDDGLPATYEEFFALCRYMADKGITPIAWAGQQQVYFSEYLVALMADYEGKDSFMQNYTFAGTARGLLNDDLTAMAPVELDKSKGYTLSRQAGKYNAFYFAEQLIKGNYYSNEHSYSSAISHMKMQSDFLNSRYNSTKDIGMLIEGNFWENEAEATFKAMSNIPGAGRYERRIGFMPYPKADASKVGEGVTLIDRLYSAGFVKASIAADKVDLAKLFMKYSHTNAALVDFTVTTGSPKALNYTLTSGDLSKMSYYGRSLWTLRQYADIVYPYASNTLYMNAPSSFSTSLYMGANISGTPYNYPSNAMKYNNVTAKQYFLGTIAANSQAVWNNAYSKYFG